MGGALPHQLVFKKMFPRVCPQASLVEVLPQLSFPLPSGSFLCQGDIQLASTMPEMMIDRSFTLI